MTTDLECADTSALSMSGDMSPEKKSGGVPPHSKLSWPHAPPHWTFEPGLYMITAGTCQKELFFNSPDRLDLLMRTLFDCAQEFGWSLHAWAIMANHYHFVARSPNDPGNLRKMLGKVHMLSAKEVNRLDGAAGRKVWFQFWDSHITFERSYLARLRYVHENPVHHGVVHAAGEYRWCSSAWFERNATTSFRKTLETFKTDRVNVYDAYDLECADMSALSMPGDMSPEKKSGGVPPHSKPAGGQP